MPSSLVRRTFICGLEDTPYADGLQVKAVGRGGVARLARGAVPRAGRAKLASAPDARPASSPPAMRTMWRMKVSASIQNASTSSASVHPLGAEHLALEAHVVGLRCGVKAVKSCVPSSAAAQSSSAARSSGRGQHSARPALERARAAGAASTR